MMKKSLPLCRGEGGGGGGGGDEIPTPSLLLTHDRALKTHVDGISALAPLDLSCPPPA